MGQLVNLLEWKKEKEEKEIEELRQQVREVMESMGPPEQEFFSSQDESDFLSRMTSLMLTTLDGYSKWPIDSTDM